MRATVLLLLLTCACFSQKTRTRTPKVPRGFLLRVPQELRPSLNASLILRDQAESFRFLAELEASPEELTLVGFTPFATRAFLIRYDGQQVSFARHIPGALPMKPEKLLTLVQCALWPELNEASPWHAEVHADGTLWQWRQGRRPRLEIRYNGLPREPGSAAVRDLEHPLNLIIELIEVEPAP